MRLLALFKKSVLENVRDWKILILTLTFAPFFVVLMDLYFGNVSNSYQVIVINHDQPVLNNNEPFNAGQELISQMRQFKNPDGTPILKIDVKKDINRAREKLEDRSVDLIVEIPVDFSTILQNYRGNQESPQATVRTYGNLANPRYMIAAAMSDAFTYQYAAETTRYKGPLDFQWETIGRTKSISDFDLYVPCLLALALIMLMFTAAASLIKEKDKGTIIRLRLSKMTFTEFFTSISLTQIIIGLVALALTFLTAVGLGYQTSGSLVNVMAIGALSCMSVIAISLVVAGFLRTIFDLMTVGCFPFFILMFFSGAMFPLPSLHVFSIAGHAVNANDILPTTHTISAFNKILNFNASLAEVTFEIAVMVILTLVYFLIGLWLFRKRHL